jgi:hypothetical protein
MADALATLLHISDLHIGDIDPTSGNNTLDAEVMNLWHTASVFQGYLGHTHRALCHLVDLCKDVFENEQNPHVVVTGDITATGADGQYATALGYLYRSLADPITGLPLGLELAQVSPMIPGNHDHWPGVRCAARRLAFCMIGASTPGLSRTFDQLPIPLLHIPLPMTPQCTLVVAGLNSDADVGSRKIPRFFARGSFVTQCGAVFAMLGARRPDQLRVLLVHHSAIEVGVSRFQLRMEPESRRRLAETVQKTGIAMVLTGHQHWVDYARPEDDPAVVIREARCGTTTARDYFEPGSGRSDRLRRNTALIHRLFADDRGGIRWETEVHARRNDVGPFDRVETINFGRVWP